MHITQRKISRRSTNIDKSEMGIIIVIEQPMYNKNDFKPYILAEIDANDIKGL